MKGIEMSNIEKPERCMAEHLAKLIFLEYLDELRDSGVTNMLGAQPYLKREYPKLSKEDAGAILSYWMKTFSERHPKT